ncbi:SusC/RagA family TonB-linked outer membrane protein [Flavobacterium faecale]|uniref:SusC/RagA family TonB-linked outer membrane protein n=1 Tax=Flavobacterium faecale TaxID=1355330 RepID=A0A2S1LHN9_9FLAO|nr:TonB-dependent receptor [Flavobacterium faecale]AWG23310.1 SusC/RagA family TonB-linked outer membrane protein [Flavobacterium faecale]
MKQSKHFRSASALSSRLKMTCKLTALFCMGTVGSRAATDHFEKEFNFIQTEVSNPSLKQITIKGTVKDEDGMPIPGVNVNVKGTTIGTTTDIDGNYTLAAPDTAKVLVFSYLGLKTTEVAINGKTVLNTVMKNDAATLEEVVVVGYGTVRKSDVTGSLSSVSTEEMNKTQNTSIAQAIQGRAAGVTVAKGSGGPGATPTVRIRGVGTVNNADPLYVVDGVPISDISSVNMADAKSVEVLKDASATAIYGSRGANGVVLITTNGGKKGKTVVSYKTYTSFDKRIDNLDVLNSEQWATLYNEANANDGKAADPNLANPSSLPNYDWKDAAYRGGSIQSHQVSASGGTEKSTFYVGFGYINQKGIINESSYKRTNFRVNNTYQISPKIKLGNNIQYAVSNTQSIPSYGGNSNAKAAFSGFFIDPVTPFYNADGSYSLPKYAAQPINPLGLTKFGVTPEKKENFLGSVFVEADIIKDLTFRSNFGLQINNTSVDNYKPAYYVSPLFSSPVSTYDLSRSENRSIILSNTLNYNKTIAKKHYITGLLGQEIQNANTNNVNASRNSIPTSVGQPTINAGDVASSTNGGSISQSKLLSFFGRFNYNFDDRYLLTGTYRMDGSSRFGANNRWAKFPSLAGAWNVHKENFFKVDAISQFKVRAGWGETGNQNIPNAAIYNTLNVGTNSIAGKDETTALGVAPLTPGNANLKWETTITTNVGVDMGFLNNSITLTADYFIKNTSDMLMATPILYSSGYANSPYTNAGNIQNKGLELTLNYKKTIKDFSFNVGGNISFIRNKVTALASEGSIIQTGFGNNFYNISRTEVGHPLASFYGYQMVGIFQNQKDITDNPSLLNTQPGDVKYKDIDGDGQITDNDRTYIGSPFPKFTYGLNLDLAYKQFDFTAFFQGSQGNKIFNTTDYWLEGDYASNSSTSVLGRWTGEGTSNTVPRATFTNAGNNNLQSSRFVKDGSYLRLKNVQLGYTFTKSVLNAISLQNLRIYVAAQNLLTFTKYDGVDPELGVDSSQDSPLDIGIDRGRYPSVRSFSLGLDINF